MDAIINTGQVTVNEVIFALRDLSGRAKFKDILNTVLINRSGNISYYKDEINFRNTTFQCIQRHCKIYKKYRGPEIFIKNQGYFEFLESNIDSYNDLVKKINVFQQTTPLAADIELPTSPEKVEQHIYRILRDTVLARIVKEENHYECEICGETLNLKEGRLYAEAHHIMPLGRSHDGPDVRENIICVCPNDHVRLDYGAIALDIRELSGVGKEYVDYHNEKIYKNK